MSQTLSRKLVLSLAAVATLASTAFVAGSADAMVAQRGGRIGLRPPIHQLPPRFHGPRFHEHVRLHRIYERGYVRPVALVSPVAEGPCTCLWKGYTPDGTVVFKDLCTKESASASVDGAPAPASEVQAPANFAGKSYQDYLAANPPKASAEPQKN
jgi:hypothetical protein